MDAELTKALEAERESRLLLFRASFDVEVEREWHEVVRDLVALANSGGGMIVIGVDRAGAPTGVDVTRVLRLESQRIHDRICDATGVSYSDFQVLRATKDRCQLAVLRAGPAPVPLVFTRNARSNSEGHPGAFEAGKAYFRHGTTSEPGTTEDLGHAIERRLVELRKAWIAGIKKVVHAPPGSRVVVSSTGNEEETDQPDALAIRVVDDSSAPAYRAVDIDQTHPYRQKELIAHVNRRLPEGVAINSYDVLALKKVHELDTESRFFHKPRFGTSQYSPKLVEWILHRYKKDPSFIARARAQYSRLRRSASPRVRRGN